MKEIVIKIDDDIYSRITQGWVCRTADKFIILDAISNGKLLPPGHGKIGDLDKIEADFNEKCCGECSCCLYSYGYDNCGLFKDAEVLIEADKEVSNEH